MNELKKFTDAVLADLASHKAAIERLNENLEAEHAKMKEIADMVNNHEMLLAEYRKVWTENFERLTELVNQHTRAIDSLRSVILPPTVN